MKIDYKKYNVENKKINIKIAHISDIHFSKNYKIKRLDIVTKKINNIKPDYICITGDLIDTYNVTKEPNFKYFIDWIKQLSTVAQVIISLGNHEYIKTTTNKTIINNDIKWLKDIENEKIIILDNQTYIANNITFIGYNPNYEYYYKTNEKNINTKDLSNLLENIKNNYNILLIHTPSPIINNDNYKKIKNFKKINLILCGHTHGGLIPSFIPGHFGIISPNKKLFPINIRGNIKINNTNIIISSGIVKLSEKSKLSKYNDIYGTNVNEINIFTKK